MSSRRSPKWEVAGEPRVSDSHIANGEEMRPEADYMAETFCLRSVEILLLLLSCICYLSGDDYKEWAVIVSQTRSLFFCISLVVLEESR